MSPTIRADPSARTLTTDAGKLRVRSVITTIEPDRAGDVVVPTGLKNLDEFLLNPVVLWAHNRSHFPPIGICEWIDIQPHRLVAQTVALQKGMVRDVGLRHWLGQLGDDPGGKWWRTTPSDVMGKLFA